MRKTTWVLVLTLAFASCRDFLGSVDLSAVLAPADSTSGSKAPTEAMEEDKHIFLEEIYSALVAREESGTMGQKLPASISAA